MRKYEETHPWITFGCNLREADPRLWIALGEAASKCEHISNVPLRPTTAQQLHFVYLAKGVAATTAIEGNTLSEDEVMKAVEGRLDTSPSKRYQQQEVENVIGVCNEICRQVKAGALPDLSTDLLCAYNRRVLKDLEVGEEVVPGELRSHSVVVGNVYRGAPAEDGPFLLDRLFEWLNGNDFKAPEGSQPCLETAFAIIRAIVAHLYLAWIHPFADGNGRTARLIELYILLMAGVPSPAAHLLSNHYNQTRPEYYRQLDRASKSGGDVVPFISYAVQGFVDGLREQLGRIWDQQWDITWQHYVYDCFKGQHTPARVRQQHIALDLGNQSGPVEAARVPELTPVLARDFAGKSLKIVQMDLNNLVKMGLVIREGRQVRANRDLIYGLLPLKHGTGITSENLTRKSQQK